MLPNGTFLVISALIGTIGTTLATQGVGSTGLDGAIVTVLLAVLAHFAQNSAPPAKA